jgi:hypothetical protein
MGGECSLHGKEKNCNRNRYLKRRDHLENLGIDGRKILKWILRKYREREWTGFIWLRIETSGGLL